MDLREKRKSKDLALEGRTARWYDRMSRESRVEEMAGYAREFSKHAKPGCSILEVAPGPGYLAIELAKGGGYNITGLDISRDMVEIASKNAKAEGLDITFRQGSASQMPFQGGSFDLIVCTAAFKNFREPVKALDEMHRVLRPGGEALIGDMNKDTTDLEIDALIKQYDMKLITRIFTKSALKSLCKVAYTRGDFESMVSASAFKSCNITQDGIGFLIQLSKIQTP